MLNIVIGAFVSLVLTVFCFKFGDDNDYSSLINVGILSAFGCLILSLFLGFAGWFYVAAKHKADIINKEYDKNYTQEQIFYAGDVIDIIRELDRRRIELNGNLFKEK